MTYLTPPPFLLAAGLLFWGWHAEFLYAAAAMSAALEVPRFVRLRWELSRRDFERVADLCTVAFASALVLSFVQSRHFPDSLVSVLVWLPMLFFGLILVQRYSTLERVPLSALFWSLRRRTAEDRDVEDRDVEHRNVEHRNVEHRRNGRQDGASMPLDYAYFCLCLLAASSANPRTLWFFPGVSALALYALWPAAPVKGRWSARLMVFAAACALAYAIQAGLLRAQNSLEELVFEWLANRWSAVSDPYRTRTAIGDIGELKSSDRIILRADASGAQPPGKLRVAAYNSYAAGTWTAPAQVFTSIGGDEKTWSISPGHGARVRLSAWLEPNNALLALPLGTYRLESLNVAGLQRNGLGAVRIDEGPDMLLFDAHYDPLHSLDAAPDSADLRLPSSLRQALDRAAVEIGGGDDPREKVQAIAAFFEAHFAYSLALSRRSGEARSVAQFLLEDRRGHCEYFATATVLLLRHAGIPARYATGYAVQEWSPLERQYVVRRRHGHAWALAWVDGAWREVDTTPAVWAAEEKAAASALQPLYDVLSLLYYRINVWQSTETGSSSSAPMLWLAGGLALYLTWSIWRRRRVSTPAAATGTPRPRTVPDRRIAALLHRLHALGHVRPPGAPLLRWIRELPLSDAELRSLLEEAVRGYYRLRFDPDGRTPAREQAFERQIQVLGERLGIAPTPPMFS